MLQKAHGDNAMSNVRVYELYNRFKTDTDSSIEDRPGRGRPSTSDVDDLPIAVRETIRLIPQVDYKDCSKSWVKR